MSAPLMLRFGSFELDTEDGHLRRQGEAVKLAPQPLKVLELLARHSGHVVTRSQIRDHVWCGETFVDFDQGLNFCIRQIREALGDSADAPRFIETLPRRGYRFLMPVTTVERNARVDPTRLIVLPFRQLRPDADTDFLAFSLPDALTGSLSGLETLVVRSSMVASRFAGSDMADPGRIASEAAVDRIVTGTLLRAGDDVRVSAQLTDASSGTLLWSGTAQAPVRDLFHLQDELTQRIVASLSLPLTAREKQLLGRDVPASASAYEFFLRGNQAGQDPKQYAIARDLYLRAVEEDARYAPAWARLGRIHHVMAKYVEREGQDGFSRAEEAFQRALALNPDLTLAHKLYAQLEVDLGRAREAIARLLRLERPQDAERLAALVSPCRYCGLLDGSAGAHERAVSIDPRVRTSVPHTWFMQGNHARVAAIPVAEYPYIVPLSLAELGRAGEALPVLRQIEANLQTRVPGFVVAVRTLLEGHAAESVAAVDKVVASGFRDPEGLFYLSRHLAHLKQIDRALVLFERVVSGGFVCFPAMTADPWLAPLRRRTAFTKSLRVAEARHHDAAEMFEELGGDRVCGLAPARPPSDRGQSSSMPR